MKVSLLTNQLQEKLTMVNRIVSPRAQLPILQNILLLVKSGMLTITATDLEMGIQTEIPASINKEGIVAIPAKSFVELIGTITEEKTTLEAKEKTLVVQTVKTKSTFPLVDHEDFPTLYKDLGENILIVEKEVLQKEFPRIIFSASTDTARPALSGVHMGKNDKKTINVVATDGYRLSLKNFSSLGKTTNKDVLENPLLIPARVLKEVLFVKEGQEKISVFVSNQNNQVIFRIGSTYIVGRIIDAEFPAYEKIIPVDVATSAIFDKEEMYRALKICSIFARESANIIRFSVKKDKILVSAASPTVGENTVEVESKVKGEENDIAFNARFLLDLFSHIDEEEVVFEMTGPLNPGVFKIKDDPSCLHLIMPIRIQGSS